MGRIFDTLDIIPVGIADEVIADHKVLVNEGDNLPDYLFDKQAESSQIGFVEDADNPGKFKVVLDIHGGGGVGGDESSGLLRVISPFSQQQIDDTYVGLNGAQNTSRIFMFPITISIGEIKNVSIYTVSQNDVFAIDRLQVAILSNTENKLANSKVEFFGQYGYGDSKDNLIPAGDYKTYNVKEGSTYNGINDLSCNFHFVALFVHVSQDAQGASNVGLLAKNKSGSPLVEAGKKMAYCGQENNKSSLFDGVIDESTYKIDSTYEPTTNINDNFPYIEFYQLRG